MKKILAILIMVSIFIGTSGVSSYAATQSESPEATLSKIEDIISNEIVVNSDGIKVENEKDIIKELKSVDLQPIEELAKSQGVVYGGKLTEEKVVELFTDSIKSVNNDIKKGKLKVLNKGTIVEAGDDNFYLQGGSTYDETYWWGKKRYKSTANANKWVSDLNTAANANGAAALLAGVIFGAVGAIPNGLTSFYCYQLANKVSYYNSLNSRGIVAKLTWLLVFTVDNQ